MIAVGAFLLFLLAAQTAIAAVAGRRPIAVEVANAAKAEPFLGWRVHCKASMAQCLECGWTFETSMLVWRHDRYRACPYQVRAHESCRRSPYQRSTN